MLWSREAAPDSLVIAGARVLDQVQALDARLDVRVDHGVISEIGESLEPNGHRVVDGTGLLLAPAFVDPHVHLRTPGQEYKEDLATGTAAAAAGGYCAVVAMPNTDPTVDDPSVLRALTDAARSLGSGPQAVLAALEQRAWKPDGIAA